MYGAWRSEPKVVMPGFCTPDYLVRFTTTGVECIDKRPADKIYMYVKVPILDPVLDSYVQRLSQMYSSSRWKNKAEWKCELSALCLPLMGEI